MQYHIARGVYKKISVLSVALAFLFSILSGTVLPVALSNLATAAPYGNTIVRQNNLNGWTGTNNASGGSTSFIADATAPYGNGAIELITNNTTASRAQRSTAVLPNIKLSDLTSLSYYTKYISGPPVAAPALQLKINGLTSTSGTVTFNYEPYWNGTVDLSGSWQQWNVLNAGKLNSATNAGIYTNSSGGPPHYTIAEILAANPNAKITSLLLNIGTYNQNYVVRADGININGKVYDFEPNANPVINGENFNTHSGADYKGINVGFNIHDFGTVTEVTVDLYKDTTKLATNTSNDALLTLINNGETRLSTPFIIENGTYGTEMYWNLGAHALGLNTKPTKATVTVTGENGTDTIDITPLTEPNNWTYESLIPPDTPTNFFFTKTANDTNNSISCNSTVNWAIQTSDPGDKFGAWAHWDSAPHTKYHIETFYKDGGNWVKLHNSNNSKPMPYRFYGLGSNGDGLYRIKVVAYNTQTGAHSDPANCNLNYDNTKPVGTATYSGGTDISGVRYVKSIDDLSFTETITDNYSVVRATFLVQKLNTSTNAFEGFCGNWNANSSGSHVLGGSTSETYTESDIKSCASDPSKWTDGTYKIFHAAYDEAGNEGKYNTDRQIFVIDSTAPAAPTGLNYTTTLGKVLNSGDSTNETKGTFDWGDVSDAVKYGLYTWNDNPSSPSYAADFSGRHFASWFTDSQVPGDLEFQQAGELPQHVCITAVDAAGNESDCSEVFSLTLDQTAPIAPVISNATPTGASGTAEPDATIIIKDTDDNILGSGTADIDNNWAVAFTASPGTTIVAFATDAAGNISSESAPYTIPTPSDEIGDVIDGNNAFFNALAFIPAVLGVQFNTNNPRVLGLPNNDGANNQNNQNQGSVKSTSIDKGQKEKELAEEASSTFAWYWILLLIAAAVAMYYAYRNWKLNKEKA